MLGLRFPGTQARAQIGLPAATRAHYEFWDRVNFRRMIAAWIHKSLAPYRKYAVFSGRSDVAEYVAFCILQLLVLIAVLTAAPSEVLAAEGAQAPSPGWFVAYALFWFASVLPWFALVARRFHDQGRSGKLAWLALAPWVALGFGPPVLGVVLWMALLLWLALPGQQVPNEYGQPEPGWASPTPLPEVAGDPVTEIPTEEGPILPTRASSLNNWQHDLPTPPVPRVPSAAEPLSQDTVRGPQLESANEVSHGVRLGDDNRYHARGYSFSMLQQAEAYVARARSHGLPAGTLRLPIHDNGRFPVPPPPAPSSTPRQPAPQPAQLGEPPTRWITGPERVEIAGQSFTLELTYFGKAKDRYAWPSHNSLIDPTLAVADEGTWDDLGYWPNYTQMSPSQRRSYLDWLANGRSDPTTPIGFVFVFFYGLERRLALDHADADAASILAELGRLHAIYGASRSFDRYATNLIEFAEYQLGGSNLALTPETARALQNGYELPLRVRVALGQALVDGGRLNADQALCWALAAPGSYLRTPGTRCFEELCDLWRVRFAHSYPEGLAVRSGKRHVTGQYRPASGGYTAEINFPKLPDVASYSTERLQRMLDDCTTALDSYSRFLGRNPELAQTVQAGALLPKELRGGKAGRLLAEACAKLSQIAGKRGGSSFGAVRSILALSDLPAGEKIAARDMKDMADVLDAVDFGFEPDRRFGKVGTVFPETPLALFPASGGGHVDGESPVYAAARVMAEISALAAIADGMAVDEELRCVARDLVEFGLSEAQTNRLLALVHAILIDPPHARAAMRRAIELPQPERARIVDAAIGAVLADGKVLPAEVRFLEALHKTLGFNSEAVYSRLHRGAVEEELASIVPAATRPGSAIPEEERQRAAVSIDEGRLARIRQETSAVSVLLSEIFVTDEEPQRASLNTGSNDKGAYSGLDPSHSQVLDALHQGAMPRAEFEDMTRELKLLPAGAMETINDWAFEQFGEAILDDDDPVAIIEYLRGDIAAARGQG